MQRRIFIKLTGMSAAVPTIEPAQGPKAAPPKVRFKVGTQNGSSDPLHSARPFSGSLNFQQDEDGEAPSIDFAGAGRAVPWATWYEENSTLGPAPFIRGTAVLDRAAWT